MSPTAAPAARDRLRIAIQKSGRLSEPARALLASCGLSWRESRDRLFCYGETLPVVPVEISASSHPFWTGNQRVLDTAGRVEKFNQRYGARTRS